MTKLPVVSGTKTIKALRRAGFVRDRQVGSHVTMRHHDRRRSATVPLHGSHDLPHGTLRSILRQADLSVQEFCDLL